MSVNDDAIALKGGKGPWADQDPNNGGNSNIIIEDCTYGFCHGALTCGSESIHNRNIILRRIHITNANRLLWLKMRPDTPQQYEYILVEDITGGGNEDLILMSTLEDGGVQIELLTVDRDGMFQQVAVMGLSADKFSGCAAVAAGLGADGKRYLVLDGWTGLSGNNLATVLLYFDEESQQMLPAEQISTSELYNASLRNVSTLVSRDLDGDGIVEIPTSPTKRAC